MRLYEIDMVLMCTNALDDDTECRTTALYSESMTLDKSKRELSPNFLTIAYFKCTSDKRYNLDQVIFHKFITTSCLNGCDLVNQRELPFLFYFQHQTNNIYKSIQSRQTLPRFTEKSDFINVYFIWILIKNHTLRLLRVKGHNHSLLIIKRHIYRLVTLKETSL